MGFFMYENIWLILIFITVLVGILLLFNPIPFKKIQMTLRNIQIFFRLIINALFYFIFSYLTVFISMLIISLSEDGAFFETLDKPVIITALLSTISTYLIGLYYSSKDSSETMEKLIFFVITISIAVFAFVFAREVFFVDKVMNISKLVNLTHLMLFMSFVFTFLVKVDLKDLSKNIAMQKKADEIREKEKVDLPSGKSLEL